MFRRKSLKRFYKSDSGFTLTELLVTITIIGILSTIMVMGVSRVQSNSNTSACQNAYQAYSLGYAAFQSDYGGASPGELLNLNVAGYVDSNLLNSKEFSLQFGAYRVTSYTRGTTSLSVDFTASWITQGNPPPGIANSNALISGISDAIDGRYQLSGAPIFVSGNTYRVNLVATAGVATSTTTVAESSPPSVISILSEAIGSETQIQSPYETYLFRDDGTRVLGGGSANLAPAACSFLR